MPTVNAIGLASFMHLIEQRIGRLVKEGMPKEARVQYDPIKCVARDSGYLQPAIAQ
jgi:hypothetical protein